MSVWDECPKCGTNWLAFALPPAARGADLAVVLGVRESAAFLRRYVPAAAELPEELLWQFTLAEPQHAAFVQLVVRPRERHLHRYASVPELLRVLQVL
jgi:hypothetical protein